MTTVIRSQNHLAQLLNIDKATCSQQVRRGMPTTSVEAAQAWRRANLNPARRKPPLPAPAPPPELSAAFKHAQALTEAAALVLAAGGSIETMVPTLRPALRAVPPHERDGLEVDLTVWRVLVAHVMAIADADEAANPGSTTTTEPITDEAAQWMGEFWYQVAAGEWVLTEP